MGIKFEPLTWEQIERLDSNGERMWTEQELKIIRQNVHFYDSVQKLAETRCKLTDCLYIIQDTKATYVVLGVGIVCDACHHMARAVAAVNLRSNPFKDN